MGTTRSHSSSPKGRREISTVQEPASDSLEPLDKEQRWPAAVALAAVGLLYLALPHYLVVGPRWLLLALVVILLPPTLLTHKHGNLGLNRVLGLTIAAIVTFFMIYSLALLVHALPSRAEAPVRLLMSAAALWVTNVIVFASWYWHLDAGGPNERERVVGHTRGAFLFPQMIVPSDQRSERGVDNWSPEFVDYLSCSSKPLPALRADPSRHALPGLRPPLPKKWRGCGGTQTGEPIRLAEPTFAVSPGAARRSPLKWGY
jgi:hypothetical protein